MITMEDHNNDIMIDKQNDQWEVNVYGRGTPYPFVLIDSWYSSKEESNVWSEIDFFERNNFLKKDSTGGDGSVATYDDGISKAKNKRIFLGEIFKNNFASHINNYLYKQRTSEFKEIIQYCQPYHRSFESANAESTMISFYNDGDYYDTHYDSTAWTCLIWMVKEPRNFDGGDFIFPEINHNIELKNNRMVMFPSCFNHQVSKLNYKNKNDTDVGKYTITHFYVHIPTSFYVDKS